MKTLLHFLNGPYIRLCRLNRPIGIWLLFFPCLWSFMAAGAGPDAFKWMALFFLGAVVMRGAGCTYNDMVDQPYDQQVARTKNRPLAARLLSKKQAAVFLMVQLVAALIIALNLPVSAYPIIGISLALVMIYPWVKRFTHWPQLFLALTYNMGIFMVYKVLNKPIDLAAVFLYLAGVCWTIGYDTIYAFQDWKDDRYAQIKSTALRFRHCPKTFLTVIYGMVLIFLVAHGKVQHWPFISYGAMAAVAAHYAWQIVRLDIENPPLCHLLFVKNTTVGCLITLGLWLANQRF